MVLSWVCMLMVGGSDGERSGPLIRINMPSRILRPGEDGGMTYSTYAGS